MNTKYALFLIAACALPIRAGAQKSIETPAAATTLACPQAGQLKPEQIYGQWRVRFDNPPHGLPVDATMQIVRHAEFSESVAGFVHRQPVAAGAGLLAGHAAKAQLAGDLEDGFLTLDESSNGVSITGTWNGEMVEGSCGKKFKGRWKDTSDKAPSDAPDIAFTLDKLPGW